MTVIGEDALELVNHLKEGIEVFRTQIIVLVMLAGLLTIFLIPFLQQMIISAPSFRPMMTAYSLFILVIICFTLRTWNVYASYRGRYARMIDAAAEFKKAKHVGNE
jgi:quinol-cytochrome oxidoreductase complex cytochrome b subunit